MKGWGWTTRGLRTRANLLLALSMVIVLAGICAGLAAHGWQGFLAVVAAYCIARVMERPWLVSRMGQPGGNLALSQTLAVQVALVLALYWLGFGISTLTGWQPALPVWMPAAVIIASAVLSRMIWRPMPPEWDSFLDESTEKLTTMVAEIKAMAAKEPDDDTDTASDRRGAAEQSCKDRE